MKATHLEDRARLASRALVGRYYRELESDEFRDRKVVYLYTSGSIAELFRSFGFRVVFPEINCIHISRNNAAVEMIHHGEALGYGSHICSYVKSDLGLMAGPPQGQTPFGKIPKPDLIVINHTGCSTYIKWAEALQREFGCETRIVDVPFIREEGRTEFDHQYVRTQIEELIPTCEALSGRKFDQDKLREILGLTKETIDLWMRLLDFGKIKPAPFDGYFDAVSYLAPMTIWRGTQDSVNFYKIVIEQIEERVRNRFSPVGEEKFRLLFDGSPPWPRFKEFRKMFTDWKAVGVATTYVRVVCACEEVEFGPDKPMDYLASLATQSYYNWNHMKKLRFIEKMARDFDVDGIIAHSVRSCKPMSLGQLDLRSYFAGEAGIPSLFLDSDMADPRYFTMAQTRDRVSTFFEAMKIAKKHAAGHRIV